MLRTAAPSMAAARPQRAAEAHRARMADRALERLGASDAAVLAQINDPAADAAVELATTDHEFINGGRDPILHDNRKKEQFRAAAGMAVSAVNKRKPPQTGGLK